MSRFDRWSHEGAPSGAALDAINRSITQAMRETLRSPPCDPGKGSSGYAPEPERREPVRRGTGWVDPGPLANPPGQEVIERLTNAMLPHGKESKAG
jgi:hypothetical protein